MLSRKQLTTITVNSIVVKMLITYPREIFRVCGNAAWINIIYCTLISAILFCITRLFYNSEYNVIELAGRKGGKVFKIITGLIVFLVMSADFFSIVRIFPEVIRLVLLQGTYLEIIGVVFIIALILGAMCGIEAIGRVHSIFVPIAGGLFVIFILLLIPKFRFDNLFPLLGTGASKIFVRGLSSLSIFSDLLMLNILIPYMEYPGDYKLTGSKSIWISGACSLLIVLAYGLTYTYPVSLNFLAPVYQLERLIDLSNFFSRFEAFFQFIWSISILLHGSLYLAVLAEVWKMSFDLKDSKPVILPIAAIIMGFAILPATVNQMTIWEVIINKWLYIPIFFIPLAFGIYQKAKKK